MTREEICERLTGRRLRASWGGNSLDYGKIVSATPDIHRPRKVRPQDADGDWEEFEDRWVDTTMVSWKTRNAEDCPVCGAFFPEACEQLLEGRKISPCEGWEYWLEPEKDKEK